MIFPPAFLDSSSCWNTNHNQLQLQQLASNNIATTPSLAAAAGGAGGGGGNNNHPSQDGAMATATGGGGGGGGGGEGDGDGGPNKPMSMSERARLARVPQPEPGLNCPRCDSTNTKFCYFNNYSLTQPRHFCRACRRYWTRGGALRNVPVGGGYRRHAKRSTKPKASAGAAAAAGTTSATSTTPSSATNCTGSATAAVPPGMQYSMFSNSAPPQGRFADSFDPASLGLSFPARLLFGDGNGAYATDGGVHHHQANGNAMEQWASMAQMQGFPFLHAMDHQMAGNPPPTTTMAAMQGMFHLGLQSGGGRSNGEDARDHQFHHHETPQAKRDNHHQQQQQEQQDYPSGRSMYGDVVNGNGGGYNFYSSASNAAGN
ncbi:uncharacterized protein [Lolium perenne]|uniref:uncharacterized protein n=1 Tax=Lolium perenne TaxID=4522 RepID=UPI0021F68AA6|nr:dof zinc finger protein DOF5.1-like [Lolium perenne]